MNFEIVTLAPVYYFLVCAAAAALLTWLLYRKNQFENQNLVKWMAALRFTGLFLLFILLLSPLIRLRQKTENKPELLVFADNSFSLDSLRQKKVATAWDQLTPELEKKFKINRYYFAADVWRSSDSAGNRNETQLGSVFDFTNEYFEGINAAAVVIISDGIHNKGINPLYKSLHKKTPVFTVGVGDTSLYPDVWLSAINANSTAFLENEFSINGNIRAYGLKNRLIRIDLYQDGVKLQSQTRSVSENTFFGTVEFLVKPNSPGMKRYELRLQAVEGESNSRNNAKSAFIRISDTRRKVAICYHAPHPDIGAIARSLDAYGQYEIVKLPASSSVDPNAYDIYLLHGFAANGKEQDLVNELAKKGKPTWLILTAQSQPQYSVFEEAGMKLQFNAGNLTDAQGMLNPAFSEFLVQDEFSAALRNWPPLKVPYGKYNMPNMFQPFLMQKIGAVETGFPLMGFTSSSGKRQAWLFGEGIWRWRIRDAEQHGNAGIFDEWVAKTIQYLTTDEVKERFRAFSENPLVGQRENATIFAEYIDQSLQLGNKPNASLKVNGPNGFAKELPFARSGLRYKAELGSLPPGDYSYTARLASSPPEAYNGRFAVVNSEPELENTRADHDMLRKLSSRNNGLFYGENDLDKLKEMLLKRTDIHTVLSEETTVKEFINLKWIFALLVVCFGAEWFLRKREGLY